MSKFRVDITSAGYTYHVVEAKDLCEAEEIAMREIEEGVVGHQVGEEIYVNETMPAAKDAVLTSGDPIQ